MVLDRFRRRKKKGPQMTKSEFLQVKPIRNPKVKWEKDSEGIITLIISFEKQGNSKKSTRRKRRSLFSSDKKLPRQKRVKLDFVGSVVWELCDEKNTLNDIINYLEEKYKMLHTEAEISLSAYFKNLSKRGLIGYIIPEDIRARLEAETKED
jgi:hypothetical protein